MADKEGKNFSLRHKKSKRVPISAPRPIPASVQTVEDPQPAPSKAPSRPRVNGRADTRGANTADLVKRRYSTRFNQPLDFGNANAPPIPSIPAIPSLGYSSQPLPRTGPVEKSHKVAVDTNVLKESSLQTEKYATDALSDATDQEIRDFQSSLEKLKNRASSDLQQNVYQNRTQFIKISKEAEKLKGEMRTLRGLMSELTTSFNQASAHAGVPEPARRPLGDDVRRRANTQANRSSVANLEALWNVQLHALWKNVEGSQKFLPAIPGRHVVLEQGSWLELDGATWKAKRHAHIFLLNDHLMIATRRKKRVDPNAMTNGDSAQKQATRLIADRCWPIQDIDMIDLASTGSVGSAEKTSMSNAISIRCGNESFTYRSDKSTAAEKTNLLLAFRRTADELRKTLRADMEENSKNKETIDYLSTRDPALSNKTDLLQSLSGSKDRPEILIEVEGKHHNLRWVEGQIDGLDSEIALHRFEEAVQRVEQLRRLAKGLKGNMIAQDLITTKVDERARKLAGKSTEFIPFPTPPSSSPCMVYVHPITIEELHSTNTAVSNTLPDILTHSLAQTHSALTPTKTNIAHLVRLTYTPQARTTYLTARASTIRQRARQLIFSGDLLLHVSQLSYVYFALIRNTVRVYQQCFPPPMMSACVKWAKEMLDEFNEVLGKQLGSVIPESKTWVECLARAKEHAAMCGEVGLEFGELVRVGRGSVVLNDDVDRDHELDHDGGGGRDGARGVGG